MHITNIKARNFIAFKNHETEPEHFKVHFSEGVNILIGENGVGKTTLLKMIYAATQMDTGSHKQTDIHHFFSPNMKKDSDLATGDSSYFQVSHSDGYFKTDLTTPDNIISNWKSDMFQSVFIPSAEMLSHSRGFMGLYNKYKLPFDITQYDIIANASIPERRTLSPLDEELLGEISKIIDGSVIYEDDTFYIMKNNGDKVDFSLEAEGFRKFGLLWQLIRNGSIDENSILLWDEPEANINSILLPTLVDILLKLQNAGVQIFIATHSYNLAKYFESRRSTTEQVLFHNLYKDECKINVDTDIYLGQLENNMLIKADEILLDEIFSKHLED